MDMKLPVVTLLCLTVTCLAERKKYDGYSLLFNMNNENQFSTGQSIYLKWV